MEFVEFHAEATGLTTASTITLPFDRSITSASDVKGVVLMAQGRATNFGWTTISHGWSVGVYDGTNEMCKWAGATRGSSDESEYREHWYDNAILVNWDEATNATYAVCSINSISTTGITLDVDDVAGTNIALKIRGYAIVGSDVDCEAKSVIQSTTTSGATTDLDYSTLTSADVVLGWAFDNDQITNTALPDEAGGSSTDYRGHYSPGQWFATTDGTRAMWGKTQDGGTLVDTAIYQKTDGKVFCTVIDVSGTLYETYVSASLQHGGTANRVRLTNDGNQSRGWGMITLAIETSNETAIGTMKRDVSDTGTETIAPGFTQVGLVQTMSLAGFGNDEDVPAQDQTGGNQFGINFGMGGNVRTDGAGVGCFGMSLSMRDANGAVRYRNVHWTASANTTMAASEADSDWLNEVASTQFAPGSTTGTTNNDVVYQYISAVNGTTGDMTVTYQDPTATGSTNKGMRTYWLAIEEGGAAAGQTLDLDTSSNAIASGEAVGSHTLLPEQLIDPSSIASGEAIGSHTVAQQQFVSPTSIDSGEAIGAHTIDTSIIISSAGSITSDEAIGAHTLDAGTVTVQPSSITSEESFGSPTLDPTSEIISIGISDGGEDIGSHTIDVGALTISAAGDIASEEAFGTASIHAEITVSPTGIASGEAFETPAILKVAYPIDPTGINDGGQSFGTLVVETANVVLPTSITSEEAHGATTVGIGTANVQPAGNDFSVGLDTPTIRTGVSVYLDDTVNASEEAFGTLTVSPGETSIEIKTTQEVDGGIPTAQAMGDTQVVGPVVVPLTNKGIASAEAFGSTVLTGNAYVELFQGISSAEIVSTSGSVTGPPAGPIQPKLPNPGGLSGIPSKEEFGTAEMVKQFPDQFPQPTSIASGEAFGSHEIVANFTVGASSIAESDNYYNGISLQGSAIQVSKNGEIIPGDAPPITAGGNDFSVAMPSNVEIRAGFTITNDPVLKPNQNGIGGMESEEAFGTHNLGPGAVGNIPSAENFGTHSVVYTPRTLEVTGIASAESLGEPTIDPEHDIIAIGISDGGEDIGTAEIQPGAITLEPTGIASEESVQEVGLDLFVQGITGIASEEAFGSATIETSFVVSAAGDIASEEAFGSAEIQATISAVIGAGIPSEEAFGSHVLDLSIALEPTGIASEESVQEVGLDLFVQGITGIASAEGVNHPVVLPGEVTIETTGLASEEAFGTAEIAATYNITDAGDIASEESVQEVGLDLFIQGATSIDSEEAHGTGNLYATVGILGVGGLASEEAFGSIEDIERTADLPSIASEEAFGTAEIAAAYNISAAGNIASEEAIGSIEDIELTVQGITGIASEEAFGTTELQSSIDIIGDVGIDNGESFGDVGLNLFIQGATSIDSEEAHGTGNIFTEIDIIVPQGIDNSEQFGDPGVNLTVGGFAGITSKETFGAAEISASYEISAAGDIASEEAFGSIEDIELTVQGITAIPSEEAFGTAEIFAEIDVIAPAGIDNGEAFGEIGVNLFIQGITGIASEEAFGTAEIQPGPVTIEATGVASEEAFGSIEDIELTVQGITAIPSEEAFGTAEIQPGPVTVEATGIASEESFGTAEIDARANLFDAGAIASEEAFGSIEDIERTADLPSIASEEAFGTALVDADIDIVAPSFIDGAEDFGTPELDRGPVTVEASAIDSEEAFGSATIQPGAVDVIAPSFIDGAEDFGTPSLEAEIDIIVTQGIDAPSPSVGVPSALPGGVTVSAAGNIASEEAIGSIEDIELTVQGITGIASEEAFGTPEATSNLDVLVDQIASGEAFGTAELQPGGVQTDAIGIASEEAFGQPTLAPGEVLVELQGVESAEAFGGAEMVPGGVATLLPGFIDGAEDVGEPSMFPGAAPVEATGIASAEAVGTLEIIQQITLVPVQYMNASWDEIQELDASSD